MRRIRRGFTLVELLVVIGIIALLAAMLFPTFRQARDSANRVGCASNLHQWGAIWHAYSNDNRGKIPVTFRDPNGAGPNRYPYSAHTLDAIAPGEFNVEKMARYVPGADTINKHLGN